jgi:hypothetical protein
MLQFLPQTLRLEIQIGKQFENERRNMVQEFKAYRIF